MYARAQIDHNAVRPQQGLVSEMVDDRELAHMERSMVCFQTTRSWMCKSSKKHDTLSIIEVGTDLRPATNSKPIAESIHFIAAGAHIVSHSADLEV